MKTKPVYRGEGADRVRYVPETVEYAPLLEWLQSMQASVLEYRKSGQLRPLLREALGSRPVDLQPGDIEGVLCESIELSARAEYFAGAAANLELILKQHTRGRWVRAPERKKVKKR